MRRATAPLFRGLLAGLLVVPTSVQAGFFDGPGTTGSSFLEVPIAARPTALGSAFTSVSGDIETIEYNPAGLSWMEQRQASASYIDFVEDTSFASASFGFPVRGRWDDRVNFGAHYRGFRAEDDVRNINGVNQGNFDVTDQLIQVAAALTLTNTLSVGVSGKFITSKLRNQSASNYASDVGVIWQPNQAVSFGLSVLNIGPETEFISDGDPLPLTARAGMGLRYKRLLFLADATGAGDEVITGNGGLEFDLNRFISLRGGALFETTLEATGGLGIRFNPSSRPEERFQPSSSGQLGQVGVPRASDRSFSFFNLEFGLDYAIQTQNELGVNQNVSVKIIF